MKPHLSASALGTLARCGLQYDYRYNQGIKSPPGVALVIGKGTHAAVEKDLRNKLEWGSLLDDEAVRDIAADETRKTWEADEPIVNDGDPDQGAAVDTAVSLATAHHHELAPTIAPVAIERGFVLELDGFPFDIMGYVDIDEATRIRDTKTASKSPSGGEADASDQLTIYHLDATVRGEGHKTVALDYIVKTRQAKTVTLESTRGPDDHARLLRKVEAAARVIESGAFYPADPGSWACSKKFCGYWSRCPFGERKAVSVGLIDPSRLTSRVVERRP